METGSSALAPTLAAANERWPDRTAITYRGSSVTFKQLWERALALAGAYQRLGIGPGDRVVCALPPSPDLIVALHAAWEVGSIHVGAHHDLTEPELTSLIQRTGAVAKVFRPPSADGGTVPSVLVRRHGKGHPQERSFDLSQLGTTPIADLLHVPRPRATAVTTPTDAAILFLTSGTTGQPKAAVDSKPGFEAKVRCFADAISPTPEDVHLLHLPMSHAFGLKLAMLALLSGGRLVLLERFSPKTALRSITTERVTVISGSPTHFALLLAELDDAHQRGSLRWGVTAAAPLPPALAAEIYDRLGIGLFSVYGCSEGFLVTTKERSAILRGSVGSHVFRGPAGCAPTGVMAVVDTETDDHLPVPAGEPGEIAFGAATPVRYWREPDTALDGWYRSGDLGCLDSQGDLHVLGRLKDLINRGGLKVAPGEVEVALARHGGVVDAAVVATPDPVLGEAICACVQAAPGACPTLGELRDFLRPTLARFKLPDELCLVEQVPRTSSGKVDRQRLAAVVAADERRQRIRPRA